MTGGARRAIPSTDWLDVVGPRGPRHSRKTVPALDPGEAFPPRIVLYKLAGDTFVLYTKIYVNMQINT